MVGGTAGLAAIAYKIFRILRTDKRSDGQNTAIDKFYEDLKKQLDAALIRADNMSSERNKAVAAEAQLTVEKTLLAERVAELRKEVEKVNGQLDASEGRERDLVFENSKLRGRLEVLGISIAATNTPSGFSAPLAPPATPLPPPDPAV